jgi:hypothetical protein
VAWRDLSPHSADESGYEGLILFAGIGNQSAVFAIWLGPGTFQWKAAFLNGPLTEAAYR